MTRDNFPQRLPPARAAGPEAQVVTRCLSYFLLFGLGTEVAVPVTVISPKPQRTDPSYTGGQNSLPGLRAKLSSPAKTFSDWF